MKPLIVLLSVSFLISCGAKQTAAPDPRTVEQADSTKSAPAAAPGREDFASRPPDNPDRREQAISIPAGTVLHVRLGETLDTKSNRPGDRFTATLSSPVSVEGKVVVPQGTAASGRIISSQSSGRLKGRAVMGLSLDSFDLNGKSYKIQTAHVARAGSAHKKRNFGFIGGGTGLGAALGAIAGGPQGALIGAGAGAAAGTAGAALTGKKNVHIPAETLLNFSLTSPVSVP